MTKVEPRVYLIASPKLHEEEILRWLADIGVESPRKVLKRMPANDAQRLVELAARRCYKSFEPALNANVKKIREDSGDYAKNILKSGHGSVLEHANFTFAFEFVSRVFTHELVRHRAGAAYSQESLRYVRLDRLGMMVPHVIAENQEALELFHDTVNQLEEVQRRLVEIFYEDMEGENAKFERKKLLQSAFRRLAPEGLATGIVATFNARALRHIITMRTSVFAEEEIRVAIGQVAEIAVTEWPLLFQDFDRVMVNGSVPEWRPVYGKV